MLANRINLSKKVYLLRITEIAVLATVYILTARLGQLFAIDPGNVTPIWIPSGIIFAAVYLRGYYLLPGVFAGAFLGNIWAYFDFADYSNVGASLFSATLNGLGDSLCAFLGVYLVRRAANNKELFGNAKTVGHFIVYGALVGSAVSALLGVTGLAISGFLPWSEYLYIWQTWWVGDTVGVLLFAPLLIYIHLWRDWRWFDYTKQLELALFSVLFCLFCYLLVQQYFAIQLPLILAMPLLIWLVFRFKVHIALSFLFIISTVAILDTSIGSGALFGDKLNQALVELQIFVLTINMTILVFIGAVREQRLASEQQAQSESHSRRLLADLPIGVALCDMQGNLREVNQAYANILGRSIEETLKLSYWDITPKVYADQEQVQIRNLNLHGRYGPYEKEYIHRDGRMVPVRLSGIKLQVDGEELIWSSVEDISERKRAEEQLFASELRYKTLFNSAADGIIITDELGNIHSFNKMAEYIFGYSAHEVLGKNVSILVPAPHSAKHDKYIKAFKQGRTSSIVGTGREVPGVRKDGNVVPLYIAISKNEENNETRYLAVLHDIQQEKLAQQKLQHAKEQADKANKAKSDFLSAISHELRTPLHAILGFSQLLALDSNKLTKEQNESVQQITKGGEHLISLINDVLDLAKIEAGKLSYQPERVAIQLLIREASSLVEPMAQEYGIQVSLGEINEMDVLCDPDRLRQSLLNYLTNAIKYNRPKGSVTITTSLCSEKSVKVSISDTGMGLTDEQTALLFQPFQRLNAAQSDIPGTGIGLAITKSLIENMGGETGVESHVGVGSTFWLTLPITNGDAHQTMVKEAAPIKSAAKHRVTVLYIEDNPDNLKLMTMLIERYKDRFELLTAEEPEKGLSLAYTQLPDVILLDMKLPGMDGLEVLRRLRHVDQTRNIPVIALSANAMPQIRDEAIKAGIDDYLTKPIAVEAFLASIDKVLDQ